MAISGCDGTESAPRCVHTLDVDPFLAVEVEFFDSCQVLATIVSTNRVDAVREDNCGQCSSSFLHGREQVPLLRREVVALGLLETLAELIILLCP